MGSTLPRRVISPVIATSLWIGMRVDRRHRSRHCDAGHRAVFDRAFGDVDMEVETLVEAGRESQFWRRANERM